MDGTPFLFLLSSCFWRRKDLHSTLKEWKKQRPWKPSVKVTLSHQAGPGAQASQLWLPQWQSLSLTLLGPSLTDQALLLSYCMSAGGWQCCWLLSGSVWAPFFHPLIKSCTFLIGEQIFKRGKGTLPPRAFRDRVHLAMECSLGTKRITEKQMLKARDTLIWKREERARLRLTRSPAARRLPLQHSQGGVELQNGTSGDIRVQGPGQGALGMDSPHGGIGPCSDLKTQLEQEYAWEWSYRGFSLHEESMQLGHDHCPLHWGEPSPKQIEKAALNKGLCTPSSWFSFTRFLH